MYQKEYKMNKESTSSIFWKKHVLKSASKETHTQKKKKFPKVIKNSKILKRTTIFKLGDVSVVKQDK